MNIKAKFNFLILAYNSSNLLRDCIDSIRQNFEFKNYEIIIIDNGSADVSETRKICKNLGVVLIENSENIGYAGGYNVILNYSLDGYMVFMNPDARIRVFNGDSISEILLGKYDIYGPQLVNELGRKELSFYFDWIYQSVFNQTITLKFAHYLGYFSNKKMWINGPFFIIKSEVFRRINGFDNRTFLYNEEMCLKFRMIAEFESYNAAFLKGIRVLHLTKPQHINSSSMILSIESALKVCSSYGLSKIDYINIRSRHLKFRRVLWRRNKANIAELDKVIDYLEECKRDIY